MDPDGLIIRNVSSQDEGGYICRARVAETGQLEERIIQLKVILIMILLQHKYYHRLKKLPNGLDYPKTEHTWKVKLNANCCQL